MVTETGHISLSVDGVGTASETGSVQVEKPAGATVRGAYLAAATVPGYEPELTTGQVTIDGDSVAWNTVVPGPALHGQHNHWADVTTLVKPKIDGAPAGRVNFTIAESITTKIHGVILAVIFDDPGQDTDNTVVLLFGAQETDGDDFFVSLANPLDTTDPRLALEMGLGISHGVQAETDGRQFSNVDVNAQRLTSSAGGQDDGQTRAGALLTVGGLDDSRLNPEPDASPTAAGFRTDDELYNLEPFVTSGATQIHVHTDNPSGDDNIFFASFFLTVDATVAVDAPPTITSITGSEAPIQLVSGSARAAIVIEFSDPDATADASYTASVECGDGSTSTVPATSPATVTCAYTAPGVYTVAATVSDNNGGTSATENFQYVVVYDPSGGFVTGGGWIDSPAGAFAADPPLAGRANFGFVSKYRKGATTPDGSTQFQFHAAGLDFHSTEYQWLVIGGSRAQYKGSGTINGAGNYGFLLTANDAEESGGGGVDRFRVKIWDIATGDEVYDNQAGEPDDANASTALGGGSIVIHKK